MLSLSEVSDKTLIFFHEFRFYFLEFVKNKAIVPEFMPKTIREDPVRELESMIRVLNKIPDSPLKPFDSFIHFASLLDSFLNPSRIHSLKDGTFVAAIFSTSYPSRKVRRPISVQYFRFFSSPVERFMLPPGAEEPKLPGRLNYKRV